MDALKNPEILRFSVLNTTSLSPSGKQALLSILYKSVSVLKSSKVTLDYSEFIKLGTIDPSASIEKIEDALYQLERELVSVYVFQWSLSASSLRTKLIPLFDSISYGIQSYKDIKLTARIKKRFLDTLEEDLEIQNKIADITFKSKYTFPLLYLLEKTTLRTLSKKQVHSLFRAPKGYKAADLIRKVLNPAINDLSSIYPGLTVKKELRKNENKEEFFFTFEIKKGPKDIRSDSDHLSSSKKSKKKEILKKRESLKERLPLNRSENVKVISLKNRD